jgi:hypothetical protein
VAHADFGAVDDGETDLASGMMDFGCAAESIVIGYAQCRVSKFGGDCDHLLGVGGTVEETEIGVTVELCVSNHGHIIVSNICSLCSEAL